MTRLQSCAFRALALLLSLGLALSLVPHAEAEDGPQCLPWRGQYDQVVDKRTNAKVITAQHRGAFSHDVPENSIEAFKRGFAQCRPAIETDVRLTSDGELVLFHDTHIGKMLEPAYNPETNEGPNPPINQVSYADIASKPLLKPDRTTTHHVVPRLDDLIEFMAHNRSDSLIHLEVKDTPAITKAISILASADKEYPEQHFLQRFIVKMPMSEYPTPQQWRDAVDAAGAAGPIMAMPVIAPWNAATIDSGPELPDPAELHLSSNASRAVAAWAAEDAQWAPFVEVVIKDSHEFTQKVHNPTSNFGAFDSPASLALDNAEPGTVAEFVSLVHFYEKKLGAFVPVPTFVMYTDGPTAGFTVPNKYGDKRPIPATDAFYNADSSCCYLLNDRRKASRYAREEHDWRDNLDWLRSIGANVLTSDDPDTIDIYANLKGYLNTTAQPDPSTPPAGLNSSLYTRMRGSAVADYDYVTIKGWNGGASGAWGGQVCLFTDPGFYLWTVACQYENPAFSNELEIRTTGDGHMQIRDVTSGQCLYSDPQRDWAILWSHDCTSPRAKWTRTPDHRFEDVDGRQINFEWDDRYAYGYPFAYNYLTRGDTSPWSIWKLERAEGSTDPKPPHEAPSAMEKPRAPESGHRPGPDEPRHPEDKR